MSTTHKDSQLGCFHNRTDSKTILSTVCRWWLTSCPSFQLPPDKPQHTTSIQFLNCLLAAFCFEVNIFFQNILQKIQITPSQVVFSLTVRCLINVSIGCVEIGQASSHAQGEAIESHYAARCKVPFKPKGICYSMATMKVCCDTDCIHCTPDLNAEVTEHNEQQSKGTQVNKVITVIHMMLIWIKHGVCVCV